MVIEPRIGFAVDAEAGRILARAWKVCIFELYTAEAELMFMKMRVFVLTDKEFRICSRILSEFLS